MRVKQWCWNKIFELIEKSYLRKFFFYRYQYMFTPEQLCFLISKLSEIEKIEGGILEIGCAEGRTTVFLNKHLLNISSKKKYYCIDTFSGFTNQDIEYEKQKRGKSYKYEEEFIGNRKKWVENTLKMNKIFNVEVIESDICSFNFNTLPTKKISFCLIDVDLFLPVKAALEKSYPLMEKGGLIIVDDCQNHELWDGALIAYIEFCKTNNIKPEIILAKLGVIQK